MQPELTVEFFLKPGWNILQGVDDYRQAHNRFLRNGGSLSSCLCEEPFYTPKLVPGSPNPADERLPEESQCRQF